MAIVLPVKKVGPFVSSVVLYKGIQGDPGILGQLFEWTTAKKDMNYNTAQLNTSTLKISVLFNSRSKITKM